MNLIRTAMGFVSRRNIRSNRDLWHYVARMTGYVVVVTGLVAALQSSSQGVSAMLHMTGYAMAATTILALPITWEFGRMYLDLWRATQSLRELASSDQQTGLLNNRSFIARVEERLASGRAIALLLGDLDRFKTINDRHGHLRGDEVIACVGETLRQLFGDGAVLGRMGGEEYAVAIDCPFLDADTAERHTRAFAEELRQRVAAIRIEAETGTIMPSISIGIAWSRHGNGFSDLYSRADRALYLAKTAGRNRVVGEQEVEPMLVRRSFGHAAAARDPREIRADLEAVCRM